MNVNGDDALGDLPASVAHRVLAELPDRGPKVLAALRTAAALVEQAVHDEVGLRLAESAAYNVREALDAVVAGRAPVQDAVGEAWRQFEHEVAQPGNDLDASLEAFRSVMRAATERQNRISYQEARLLGYLRGKTGVDPLPEQLSPLTEYRRLRRVASTKLHQDTDLDSVSVLYQDTIAWFVRMFNTAGHCGAGATGPGPGAVAGPGAGRSVAGAGDEPAPSAAVLHLPAGSGVVGAAL